MSLDLLGVVVALVAPAALVLGLVAVVGLVVIGLSETDSA